MGSQVTTQVQKKEAQETQGVPHIALKTPYNEQKIIFFVTSDNPVYSFLTYIATNQYIDYFHDHIFFFFFEHDLGQINSGKTFAFGPQLHPAVREGAQTMSCCLLG